MMKKRFLLQAAITGLLGVHIVASAASPVVDVYKSAYCGCCADWVKHMESSGFTVKTQNVANPSDYREKYGIPQEFGSCHTAVVQGYALEGHVPATEIKRLLSEKPKAKGLAAPGMPMGSPGMEGAHKHPYDVMLVQSNGQTSVYKHYDGN
jgi:hypothetical protein